MRLHRLIGILALAPFFSATFFGEAVAAPVWPGYGGNAQHTAVSTIPSQPLTSIRWQTPVDLAPQYTGDDLLIHYGTPLVTAANTVIVPVKTGANGGFRIEAHNGADGSLLWSEANTYSLPQPPASWVPSYSPTLSPSNRLYYPVAGGIVQVRDNPDSNVPPPPQPQQLAFYGLANYTANQDAFNSNVFINTPITADAAGNLYFGYQVNNSSPQVLNLHGGIARIDAAGNGTFMEASTLAPGMAKSATNVAPALSADGTSVYVAVNDGFNGRLLQLNSSTLALQHTSPALQGVIDVSTASPTIGPDGDVYFGTNNGYRARGILNHFSADLTQVKTSASFGWDDTASIVASGLVPSYSGTSPYLLMIKYNDYAGAGGDGVNRVAIVDPNNQVQFDPILNQNVMKEVITIAGVTHDEDFPTLPQAVREWCINTGVVDPATHSVLVNNEDGRLYRWDLFTNTFTESITLTSGVGEAYTPTIIGADGKVYAINNAVLFALGVPEPAAVVSGSLALVAFAAVGLRLRGRRRGA